MQKRLLSAALAEVLVLTGCASGAIATTPARSAPVSKTTNIMVYSLNSDGAYFSAIVTGAVGDYGQAVTVDPDGTVDPGHSSEMEFRLTRGSFRLDTASMDKKLVMATSHEPIYPATCTTFVKATGTAPIIAGSGTGSYRGIGGGFAMTAEVDEVHATPCRQTLSFLRQVIMLTGRGSVSLG
jgi:hypothetical protein